MVTLTSKDMENKIKELLDKKISDRELDRLHEFYRIKNLYNYSICNRISIWLQGGSIVSGYHGWKKHGRYVKRGEHAYIFIIAPSIKTIKKVNEKGIEEKQDKLIGYYGVKVFDIKQTDGKALEYAMNSNTPVDYQYTVLADKLADKLKVKIELGITGNARGSYWRDLKSIKISEFSNNADRIKTLFHELGHHLLLSEDSNSSEYNYSAGEVEAELVSHLVCSALGLKYDISEAYIASWNKTRPQIRIIKVLGAVQKILNVLV